MTERNIEDIVELLRNARRGCSLLIGAGCSVTAGVPTAQDFVDVIKDRYPEAYARASTKTYPACMAQLAPSYRRDLIAEYVDAAKINWAHVGIAQLLKHGYVDRILTTNFDLLVARACALVGKFPAFYDLAASQLFKPADVPDQAVFYLHGQYTGFVLMNTEEDCNAHSERLTPVFEDAGSGRLWIVVGYSGENDPVFEHLAKVERFDNSLYWVGYKDNEPPAHVRTQLLSNDKYAFYIRGHDADDFFIRCAQSLQCFPPDFVAKPFSHLDALLDSLTPFDLPGTETSLNVMENARTKIRGAIEQYEAPEEVAAAATEALMSGDYEKAVSLLTGFPGELTEEMKDTLAGSYLMQGNPLLAQAKTKEGAEADRLFVEACEKYEAAVKVKPDKHQALTNWGVAVSDQAKIRQGADADRLWAEAREKYEAALEIKPDCSEALNNWGVALWEQAKTKIGLEAEELLEESCWKYEAALKVKPDLHAAFYNWGNASGEDENGTGCGPVVCGCL